MKMIDGTKALDLLRQAVKGREDFVYKRIGSLPSGFGGHCAYFTPDGEPSCLVGTALAVEGLTSDEADGENAGNVDALVEHLRCGDWEITEDATAVFEEAQIAQDGGETWGTALHRAESLAARF